MHIPEGYFQVNLKWRGGGIPHGAENTFGVSSITGATPQEVADVVDAALTASDFVDGISSACTISYILVKAGPNEDGPFYEKTVTHTGGDTGQPVPPNCGIVVRKTTAKGGRRNTGRWFLPGAGESASDGTGHLLSGAVATWQFACDKFLTELQEADLPMVLLHSTERPGEDPLLVSKLTVQSTLGTQRRRLRG